MDIQGDMTSGGSGGSATEVRVSKHEGGLEGAEQISARGTGGHMARSSSNMVENRGVSGGRQGQVGVGLPRAVVPSSAGEIGPP